MLTPHIRPRPTTPQPRTAGAAAPGSFTRRMHDLPDLLEHQVYACGAPIMVESTQRDFIARCGLPDDELYADSFTSEADKHG